VNQRPINDHNEALALLGVAKSRRWIDGIGVVGMTEASAAMFRPLLAFSGDSHVFLPGAPNKSAGRPGDGSISTATQIALEKARVARLHDSVV